MGIYLANLDLVGRFNYSDDTLTFTRPGAVLQAERDMVNFGTNIYDGACWQIVTRDWLSDDPFIGTPYFSHNEGREPA